MNCTFARLYRDEALGPQINISQFMDTMTEVKNILENKKFTDPMDCIVFICLSTIKQTGH